MASLDIRRPAAQQQLAVLGKENGIETLPIVPFETPEMITKRAFDVARKEGFDIILLDTAGRLHVDEELMGEAEAIYKMAKPSETPFRCRFSNRSRCG